MRLHTVNLGQGFKEPVEAYQHDKNYRHIEAVARAKQRMRNTIALPTGLWGGFYSYSHCLNCSFFVSSVSLIDIRIKLV